MSSRSIALVILSLALFGCNAEGGAEGGAEEGAGEDQAAATSGASTAAESAPAAEVPAAETAEQAAPEPSDQSSGQPAALPDSETAAALPEALQGRWGLVPADCTSMKGDAKGLLLIDADSLEFYESTASLAEIRETGPMRVVADFEFIGEGQTWTREMTLEVANEGQTLIRSERGEGAAPAPLEYLACEAA